MTRLKAMALTLASVVAAVAVLVSIDTGRSTRGEVTSWDIELVDPKAVESMPGSDDRLQLFERRSVGRPPSAPDQQLLARLLMERAAESGDDSLFVAAEQEYRRALTMAPGNVASQLGLASAMAAQHQFRPALELIEGVLASHPDNLDALAAVGDAYLSLGRYEEAVAAHEKLASLLPAAPANARLAHLEELYGNPEQARRILETAALEMHRSDALADDLAWYLIRLADLYFQLGDLEASARHAEVAFEVSERTFIALGQLARARAAQGRIDEAITTSEHLIQQQRHPELLGQLGDLYALAGRQQQAAALYEQVIGLAATAGPVEDRPLAKFLADHNLDPEQALLRAARDLELRPDVEAHDLYAWTLYRNGRFETAAEAIERALRLGTRRAEFYYHAGMIYGALGDIDRSISFLEEALAINPRFDPLHAPLAREHLEAQRAANTG
ncbi:MAG TPA: tetratricopeptide repeat protein [Acidobacteriota bacterium]|nr:tetratricopeptide repeat protein [Acidobacteriota bacterium]